MRLGIVSMVKNEMDIIDFFSRHMLAVADVCVVVDHSSTDGTTEFLATLAAANPDQVALRTYSRPSYDQAQLMNSVVRNDPLLAEVDWVLFLDADEFVPYELPIRNLLHRNRRHPVVSLAWINHPMVDYEADVFCAETSVWHGAEPSAHNTIAVNLPLLRTSRAWIDQGNHALLSTRWGSPIPAEVIGNVHHVPLRSRPHFERKIRGGVAAYRAQRDSWNPEHGAHWLELEQTLDEGQLTAGRLNEIALSYGGRSSGTSVEPSELTRRGFTRGPLCVAVSPTTAPPSGHKPSQPPPSHQEVEPMNDIPFEALAADPGENTKIDRDALFEHLNTSFWPIRDMVPTAWGGHLPFMFMATSALRPRRFVELGTHYGASFFAACQATERLGLNPASRCIAVDTWTGDDHTGAYGNEVFDSVAAKLASRNYDFAEMMRTTFDEASEAFASDSIDLLHIDGLHTYEAVRHDFETWLPKVVDGGVIMFHDINVHENDFGVWRLWEDIERTYPTFAFGHAHGLGVMVKGDHDGESRGHALINAMNESSALRTFLQGYFETAGPRSVAESRLEMALHELNTHGAVPKAIQSSTLRRLRSAKRYVGQTNLGAQLAPAYRSIRRRLP